MVKRENRRKAKKRVLFACFNIAPILFINFDFHVYEDPSGAVVCGKPSQIGLHRTYPYLPLWAKLTRASQSIHRETPPFPQEKPYFFAFEAFLREFRNIDHSSRALKLDSSTKPIIPEFSENRPYSMRKTPFLHF